MLNDTEASHRLVDLAAKLYSRTGVEFELSKTKDTESRTEKISYTAARENESTEDLHIESVSDDMITSPNGNVKGKYSLSTQNSGREGLSSVDNFKVSEYTHSIDARETNSNAIYSVGDPKWHTSFPQYVVKELGQRVERGAQTSTRFITDTANWYKTRINGVEYFVIYSTEESKPTVLYAAKDKRAEREREYLLDWIEVRKMPSIMTENQALLAEYLLIVGCGMAEAFKIISDLWEAKATLEMLQFCKENPNATPAELLKMSSEISLKYPTEAMDEDTH